MRQPTEHHFTTSDGTRLIYINSYVKARFLTHDPERIPSLRPHKPTININSPIAAAQVLGSGTAARLVNAITRKPRLRLSPSAEVE
jgi:hypothetical protein